MITGRCLCGSVEYTYSGSAGPAGYCHCVDCRRRSGSAFGVSVRLDKAGFSISRGHVKGFTKLAQSGTELTRHFCAECGSPIFTSSPRHPAHIFVQAGSLDDAGVVLPVHEAWTSSSVAWSRIDPDLVSFRKGRM
jgi:hypothetical protein